MFRTIGEQDLQEELVEVRLDSTSIKAHQTASTGRRRADEEKTRRTSDDAWGGAAED